MAAAGPEAFVSDLLPAIRQCVAIARSLEGRVANTPKSQEATDVKAALTVADTAAQEALLVPLLERFSDVRLEAEEDTQSVKRFTGRRDARVVIDPIDGTLRSYLQGEGPYAVMAGLALGGGFQAALVALPREGLIFHAVAGAGAVALPEAGDAASARAERDGDVILTSYDLPEAVEARLVERGYSVRGACGGAIAVAPLLPGVAGGLRIPTPAPLSSRGRIGLLISEEAGARALVADGPASTDLATPLPHVAVAANDEVASDLRHALAAA